MVVCDTNEVIPRSWLPRPRLSIAFAQPMAVKTPMAVIAAAWLAKSCRVTAGGIDGRQTRGWICARRSWVASRP
jgi:hypothetical protein